MKTKAELLQERAELVALQKALTEKAKAENRTLNEAETKEFDDRMAAIKALDQKIADIEAHEKRLAAVDDMVKDLDQPAGRPRRPDGIPGDPSANNKKLDDGGFQSIGELLDAVRFGDPKGRIHSLRRNPGQGQGVEVPDAFKALIRPQFRAEWTMGTGAEGGFAVPEQRRDQILMIQPEGAIVRPRAQVIPAGDPPDSTITIPAFTQGASGVFGGVTVQWVAEGGAKPETDGNLEEVSLTPQEVAAHTVVTDKLLRNWAAAGTFISNLLRGAVMATEDYVFLRGNGVGKPTGVLNSTGAKTVNRNTASTIKFVDVANMLAALLPEALSRAVFIANQSTMAQIVQLKDDAGNTIFIRGDITRGIPNTLLGIPIIFTGRTPVLGVKGDLILADFTYYLVKDGSGPFIAASEHVHFTNNKTVVKIFWNVDGRGWVKAALELEDGSTTVSPYVVLDVPAA